MYAVNHLPVADMSTSTTGCCPKFDPTEWDGQTFAFDGKLFAKLKTRSFMHMPLNMTKAMREAYAKIIEAGADTNEFAMLSRDTSPWHAEHYIAVTKPVPGLETAKLSGNFLAKVFEGPYREAGKWYEQLIAYVKSKGFNPVQTYFYYTTCPHCAKIYGKNFVVGLEQIAKGGG